jgi:hypothetical protein
MRKYYFISIIFLSLTSRILPQEIELQQVEYPNLLYLYDLSSSSEGDYLLTTRTRQFWNLTSSLWENDSLFEHSYNNQNLLDTTIITDWHNGIIFQVRRESCSYSGNYIILKLFSTWALSSWWDYARMHYAYANNNLSSVVLDWWNGGSWDDVDRWSYVWNNQNLITMLIYQYRNPTYGNWCYGYKYEYIYDSNNILLRIIEYDGDCCPSWHLYKQKLYTYDVNDNNIEKLGQNWNSADSIWINEFLYLYEYDNNNALVGTIYQNWDLNSLEWKNVWRESYTYTSQNTLETILKETWSSETKWENYTFRVISYGNNGNWLEDVTQLWDSTSWVNYLRYLATWDEPVTAKNDQFYLNSYQLSQNFPNPFNPTTIIKYQIPKLSFVTLKVYDVLGNEIATLVNEEKPAENYEVEFNATNLPSGIYFYQLQIGSFVETKKMVLMK